MQREYCPQCGSPVDAEARTCGTCGAVLASSFALSSGSDRQEGTSAADAPGENGHLDPLMPPMASAPETSNVTPEQDTPEQDTPEQDAPAEPQAAAAAGASVEPARQAAAPAYAYPYPYVIPSAFPQPYPGAALAPGGAQGGQPGYPGYPRYQAYPNAGGQAGAGPNGAASSSPDHRVNGASAAPGYPAYPQGIPTTYAPYPPAGYAPYGYPPNGSGYGYPPYGYGFPYPYPMYTAPRRAPGETYAVVVSWIVTVFGGLSILCGLFAGLISVAAVTGSTGEGLANLAVLAEVTIAPIVAGGFALYFGIRGIMRKPSPRFSIPSPLFFLLLTILTLGAGVALWHLAPTPGSPLLVLPLVFLAGILPAFAILAFAARRLGLPSTRRHVWMSLLYGLTLAPLLAIILELIAILIIARFSGTGSAALGLPNNVPNNPLLLVVLLLTVSLVAPVVEEGVKPLGAVLLMRRLRTPASAFLLGVAAGVGFDIFETIGYIGSGQADWITVAIERVGAGLLHGVGAGMAALGWYYLINGKGVPGRWLRGIGCIAYALVQHAVFNGVFVVTLIPSLEPWLSQSWHVGGLPFQNADFLDFGLYVIILGVLYVVTGRLARGAHLPDDVAQPPQAVPPAETMSSAGSAAVGSGAR